MAFKVMCLSSIRIVVAYWAFKCNNKKEISMLRSTKTVKNI